MYILSFLAYGVCHPLLLLVWGFYGLCALFSVFHLKSHVYHLSVCYRLDFGSCLFFVALACGFWLWFRPGLAWAVCAQVHQVLQDCTQLVAHRCYIFYIQLVLLTGVPSGAASNPGLQWDPVGFMRCFLSIVVHLSVCHLLAFGLRLLSVSFVVGLWLWFWPSLAWAVCRQRETVERKRKERRKVTSACGT